MNFTVTCETATERLDEVKACQFFIDELCKDGFDREKLWIEQKSIKYTTLVFDDKDLARVKISPRAKWIRIILSPEDRKDNGGGLFVPDKIHKMYHCSNFSDISELPRYIPFLKRSPLAGRQ